MKLIWVLGLTLFGMVSAVTANAGVAVQPGTSVQCNTVDPALGPVNINFFNARGTQITRITVVAADNGMVLRRYQGSGPLTRLGTGQVVFLSVKGPADYLLFNDAIGQLWTRFTLNGAIGATFPCYMN